MLAPLALAVVLAKLPVAYLATGSAHTPLAISSWCRAGHCGAPIAASRHVATIRRGALVRCVFGFTPTKVTVSIGGRAVDADATGNEVDWHAARGGGLTVTASAPGLWVTYVGRVRLH